MNENSRKCIKCLVLTAIVVALAILLMLWATGFITVFEDGSWAIGSFPYPLSGCLPWGICNE